MKKWVCLVLVGVLLLSSCQKANRLKADYVLKDNRPGAQQTALANKEVYFSVDNTTPHEKLITKTVDIHEVGSRCAYLLHRMSDIDEIAGLECVRKTDAGALYSVHKVKQGGLLYVFYNDEDWREATDNRPVRQWFYVREALTYEDFAGLTKGTSTMADVIAIDDTEQIFENICFGQWNPDSPEYKYAATGSWDFQSWHYLQDGILELYYHIENGQSTLTEHRWRSDFDLYDPSAGKHTPYNARILDIDRVK